MTNRGDKSMGEVQSRVKLTNAIDEALARRGQLEADQVRVYETHALVDTGAVRSVLPVHVVQRLGLASVGSGWLNTPTDGRRRSA